MPTSPSVLEHRRHCEEYTATVVELCRHDPAARRALRQGRGRPLEDCAGMHRYLARHTAGHRARRVHYTLASLIAAVDPLDDIRAAWPAPPPGWRPQASPRPDAAPSPTQLPAPPAAKPAPRPVPASRDRLPPEAASAGGAEQGHDPTALQGDQDSQGDRGAARGLAGEGPHPGTRSGTDEDRWATAQWRARPNLGTALARAVHRSGFHAERTGDLLHVLLKVGEDQLQRRLPPVVGRLLRAGAVPDWPVLLDDLIEYRFQPARVALRWQDGFYLTTPDSQPGDLR